MTESQTKSVIKTLVGGQAGLCSCKVNFQKTFLDYGIVGEKYTRFKNKVFEAFQIPNSDVNWATPNDVLEYILENQNG